MGVSDELDQEQHDAERARGLSHLARQNRSERELRTLVRGMSREIEELERDLAVAVGTQKTKPLRIPKPKSNRKGPVMPWALWSDHHIEENVPLNQTSGRNEYNLDISQRRFETLVQHTVELVQHEAKRASIGEMGLWLGGDFMSGHIHDDLIEVTELSPIECAEEIHKRLHGAMLYLLDSLKVDKLVVPTSWGNHGRITSGKPRIATAGSHNLEQMVYRLLDRDFRDDGRVTFDITPSAFKYVPVECENSTFMLRFNHGDTFRYQGGLAGLSAPFRRVTSAWDTETRADLTCVGHWHRSHDFGWGIVNGSLIGYTEFSRRFEYEPPSQTLFFIDQRRGRKAGVSPIFLD